MPEHPLKDLLGGVFKHTNVRQGVITAQVLQIANRYLDSRLPGARRQDAQAISWKNGVLLIGCRHGAVAHMMAREEGTLIAYILESFPGLELTSVRTKVMKAFPSDEM